jgi:hypothetical protein
MQCTLIYIKNVYTNSTRFFLIYIYLQTEYLVRVVTEYYKVDIYLWPIVLFYTNKTLVIRTISGKR